MKYRKTFLTGMKLSLLYFIEFYNGGSILPKIYFDNYVVRKSNQRLIIMIIYIKNIFSANDSC